MLNQPDVRDLVKSADQYVELMPTDAAKNALEALAEAVDQLDGRMNEMEEALDKIRRGLLDAAEA